MRRATLWVAVFIIASFGCVPAPGQETPATNERAQIEIHVGAKSLTDPNKATMPIPQVPVGEPFDVVVVWTYPGDEASLILSGFHSVSYHSDASWDRDESLWRPNDDILQVYDENRNELPGIVLESDGDNKVSTGTFMFRRVRGEPAPDRPSLIFFNVEIRSKCGTVFTYDPPWVEIPPTG